MPRARTDVYKLPKERLILNERAAWCNFIETEEDPRTVPQGEYAVSSAPDSVSLGLVDDISDGTIQCSLDENLHAFARIVVGPPKYSPTGRPFVSLADNLTDRKRRYDVREPRYVEENPEITSLEIQDFMERVLETVELTNIDVQNNRVFRYNRDLAVSLGLSDTDANKLAKEKVLPIISDEEKLKGRPLPLTEMETKS